VGYRVVAFNRAVVSANPVHDPEFARRVGFKDGLVPGVDVFAYMAHPVAEAWGIDWVREGALEARFAQPVYDGDDLEVRFADGPVEVVNGEGMACATGTAERRHGDPRPDPDAWPLAPLPDRPPPAAPDAFKPVLGSLEIVFSEDDALGQLEEVRERSRLFVEHRAVHPGQLLRLADSILAANVELPPWMHVSSRARFFDLAHWGERLSTRARLRDLFEKKGHRFVQLDVLVAGPRGAVMRVDPYTAIYRPAWSI
jgi:acyl dehydratase